VGPGRSDPVPRHEVSRAIPTSRFAPHDPQEASSGPSRKRGQGRKRCHSARQAWERGMRLELGNLSSQPCGSRNPARPRWAKQPEASLASCRVTARTKRRQPVPRPCDQAPKPFSSWEPSLLTQAGATSRRRNWPGVLGPAGVQEQGIGTEGLPRNLGDPAVSTDDSGSGTGPSTPRSPRPRVPAAGSKSDARVVSPWRRQRSRAKWAAGSLSAS
jgi:hypothetical protein